MQLSRSKIAPNKNVVYPPWSKSVVFVVPVHRNNRDLAFKGKGRTYKSIAECLVHGEDAVESMRVIPWCNLYVMFDIPSSFWRLCAIELSEMRVTLNRMKQATSEEKQRNVLYEQTMCFSNGHPEHLQRCFFKTYFQR